jgi:hypothetical protein
MRNSIILVAAIRNLVALANVAILAAERFAALPKPEMSRLYCGTSHATRRHRHGGSCAGGRCAVAIFQSRWPAPEFGGTGDDPMPTPHGAAQAG